MKEQIPELLGILRDEIHFYHELLECELRKTAMLAEGRVEDLMECNKAEEESIIHLQNLEARRLRICEELCKELEIPREEFTLLRLVESLDDSRELDESAALLRNVVRRVQVVGARNREMIEKPLRYVEGMLTVFANAAGPYQPNGTFNAEASVYPTFSQNA
ncbi:MAG: flagellar protein FlgN [Acidobacteriota bacterium]|nr:flagellar protein FlgN [Acidobacteriota bacterium]